MQLLLLAQAALEMMLEMLTHSLVLPTSLMRLWRVRILTEDFSDEHAGQDYQDHGP